MFAIQSTLLWLIPHPLACMFVCLHQSTVSSGLWLYWRTYKRTIYTRNLDLLANNCFVLLQFSNSAFYCSHVTCEPFELDVFVMSHFSGKSVHSDTAMWVDFLPLFIQTSCLARKAMFAHQSLFFSVSWKGAVTNPSHAVPSKQQITERPESDWNERGISLIFLQLWLCQLKQCNIFSCVILTGFAKCFVQIAAELIQYVSFVFLCPEFKL